MPMRDALTAIRLHWPLAWRFAMREWRGGLSSMRLMLLAMLLAIALITALGSLRDALFAGIEADARDLLGGDISLSRSYTQPSDEELAAVQAYGRSSTVVELRSMVGFKPKNGEIKRKLVEAKAVDDAYPLEGQVQFTPAHEHINDMHTALSEQDGQFGVLVDRAVLQMLGAELGSIVTMGDAMVQIRGVIEKEPDRIVNTYQLGPRVLISQQALVQAKLLGAGSITTWRLRVAFYDRAQDPDKVGEAILAAFPDAAWRIQTRHEAAPRLKMLLDRLHRYIGLVALAVLITGGIGIANASQIWLARRQKQVAIYKTLGAPRLLVAMVFAIQLGLSVLVAALLGIALGLLLPPMLLPNMQGDLPVSPIWSLSPLRWFMTLIFAMLVAACFVARPLMQAMALKPAAIFRAGNRALEADNAMLNRLEMMLYAAFTLPMVGIAGLLIGDMALALLFACAMLAIMLVLAGFCFATRYLLRKIAHKGGLAWRSAAANIIRPNSHAMVVLMSLGMGTTLLLAVMLMERNMQMQLGGELPEHAPSFFVLDLPDGQLDGFKGKLANMEGVGHMVTYPSVRGAITHINKVPVAEAAIDPKVRWAVMGDRMLSYSDAAPASSPVIAGKWWEAGYEGEPLLSITDDLAKGMDLAVGDYMGLRIMGTEIIGKIAAIRDVNWQNYRMNFAIMLSPNAARDLTHSHMATLKTADEDAESRFMQMMAKDYPSVAVVRLKEALEDAAMLVSRIAMVVRLVALVALCMGVVVMATAISASQNQRIYEHTILKLLGATRRRIMAMLSLEFLVLGVGAMLAAWGLGSMVAWGMMEHLLNIRYQTDIILLLTVGMLAVMMALGFGLLLTYKQLSARPLSFLRND